MKRTEDILALARKQRRMLIACLLDELEEDASITDALKAAVTAHDELMRVLEKICREGAAFHDAAPVQRDDERLRDSRRTIEVSARDSARDS